jgi:DNA-binding NtrC family response regulator
MKNRMSPTARYSPPGGGVPAAPTLLIAGPVEDGCGPDPVFDQFPWPVQRARDCLEVALHLAGRRPCIVVCERDLADCDWKDVLEVTAALPDPPPVIVTSRLADEYLWAEVLNLGGFDVLAKPLDKQEVRRVLTFAWEHWIDRAYLAKRPTADAGRKGDAAKYSTA